MLPEKIGRYRIKAELGRGGMSTVFLAHDPHFDRDVAVKLLPHELLHHGNFRRRFDREAKIVASLDHPAIVPVHDFGEQNGQPYLVMRFMAGGSLTDRLKQGAMSIREASRILSRLAPALDEVHRKNILHRDLKPSNILFDHRNEPFISDFGTAKFTFEHTKLTETGGAVGTPAYMSPEQIQGETELNGRSDIYALGVILFEMLTGQHPFQTNTPIGLAVKHIFEPIPSIRKMQPELPAVCQNIISRAMAKSPEERYQTAGRLAENLAQVAAEIEGDGHDYDSISDETAVIRPRRLALLIHTDTYDDQFFAQLRTPEADNKKLVNLLKDPNIGDFDDVTSITNESSDEIRRVISRFFAEKNSDDILLLYITGHAALDGNGHIFFASKTTDHELMRATSIPGVFLADEMDGSRAQKQVLILDCLFSKVLLSDNRPTQYVPGVVGKAIDTSATFSRHGQNRLILSASDSIHYVWQGNGISGDPEPSRFSEFLLDGLESGAADVDNNGVVTLTELYDYISDRTTAIRSNGDSRYLPRKWVDDENNQVILAKNLRPSQKKTAPPTNAKKQIGGMPFTSDSLAWAKRISQKLLWIGPLLVIGMFLISGSSDRLTNGRSTILAADAPTNTPTATFLPTNTPKPTKITATFTPTPEATKLPSVTKTATSTPLSTSVSTAAIRPTQTKEPASTESTRNNQPATTLLASSIFAEPDPDATEVAILAEGEAVSVIGVSENGSWFYVLSENAVAGFVFGERIAWDGDVTQLPKVPVTQNKAAGDACNATGCPPLNLDLYPLPGSRCENDIAYRTIYMHGQGGNGRYTYYWNDKKLTGSIVDGHGFEINNQTGDPVIGTGKVVSADGQTVEKEIFITDFDCGG